MIPSIIEFFFKINNKKSINLNNHNNSKKILINLMINNRSIVNIQNK